MRATKLFTLLAVAAAGRVCAQNEPPMLQVVTPDLPAGSRLMGFSFDIASGRVASLGRAPAGWTITIDNDPSWHARIDAHAVVGAAALETTELAGLFKMTEPPMQDRIGPHDAIRMSGHIDVMKQGELQTIDEPSVSLRAIGQPR